MFSKAFIIVLAAASSVTAFTLPANLTAGVYRAYYDENGLEVHEAITEEFFAAKRAVASAHDMATFESNLAKRAGPMWCGCGIGMNHGDCDNAVDKLKGQFHDGTAYIPGGNSYYSHSDNRGVVAFACNAAGDQRIASGAMIGKMLESVTRSCGWYVPGTQECDPNGLRVGYMNYAEGARFCDAATSSGQSQC
jgi:hypothetical protein